MAKITEWNNCPLMKDTGHFSQKKKSQVKFRLWYEVFFHESSPCSPLNWRQVAQKYLRQCGGVKHKSCTHFIAADI